MKYYTSSYEQTYELAREFAKSVRAGTLITLDGDLGAGKTAFIRKGRNGCNEKRTFVECFCRLVLVH